MPVFVDGRASKGSSDPDGRQRLLMVVGWFNVMLFCAALPSGAQDTDKPLSIGHTTQLLVDDFIIAESENVTRKLGPVTKANAGKPIFTAGWFYGTVLHDEGRFKLWYRKPGTSGYAYAESTDGVHFEKRLDVTGINFAGDYTLVVEIDPRKSDPRFRYMAGYDAPGMAAGIAYSRDGINWIPSNDGRPVTGRAADTYNQILWDGKSQIYRLFTRSDFGSPGGSTELRGTRSMTNPDPHARPTDWTLVEKWIFDKEGMSEAKRRQIYAVTCWIHHDVYFALLTVYEFPGDVSEGQTTDRQRRHERDVMNFYMATSRDGAAWDLSWVYANQPLVPRGPDRAFDKDLILPASTIVTYNDQHWIYYAGGNERHGNEEVRFDREHAIGLATLPLDRFVGICAGEEAGYVLTRPFVIQGERLVLNIDCKRGEAEVELLDMSGQPIAEFSGQNRARVVAIDDLHWHPHWTSAKLADRKGQPVRLRITLRNASLYSFGIVP